MALISTFSLDLTNGTLTLTFLNPDQVDQVVFSNNQITWPAAQPYTLQKSDLQLFVQALNTFNSLLLSNFSYVNSSIGTLLPQCEFDIAIAPNASNGVSYSQSSLGASVIGVTYTSGPKSSLGTATMDGRVAPVSITMQEWFSNMIFLSQLTSQINLL